MFSDHYGVLQAPKSADDFALAMQAVCEQAGAERFLAVRLQGLAVWEVRQVFHSVDQKAQFQLTGQLVVQQLVAAFNRSTPVSMLVGCEGQIQIPFPGFEHGVATVTRGERSACIVVFARSSPAIASSECFELMAAAHLASSCAVLGFGAEPAKVCPLSEREMQCLTCYAAGQSPKQAAQTLGISARTVEGHLERARLRCGVDSTLSAVLKALNEGWIQPSDIQQLQATG